MKGTSAITYYFPKNTQFCPLASSHCDITMRAAFSYIFSLFIPILYILSPRHVLTSSVQISNTHYPAARAPQHPRTSSLSISINSAT